MAKAKRFLPLLLLAAAALAIVLSGAYRYLSFEAVRDAGEGLRTRVEDHYLISLLVLMATFTVLTASVTPGVFFLTILAGYLFGPWVGGVATSAAATLGALAVYWAGATAARDWLKRRVEAGGGLMARICAAIDRNTFRYVLAARLVVSVPFHLINIAAGVMKAPLKPYLAATFVGVLPAHLVYCWIGSNLGSLTSESDVRGMAAKLGLPLMAVAFLSIGLPLLMRLFRRNDPAAEDQ